MNKEDEKLPALDNKELREQQLRKMVDGLDEMGKYAKDLRRTAKIGNYMGIAWLLLIFGALIAAFVAAEGFDGLIDLEASKRKFDCVSPGYNDTIRSYEDAQVFINLYGGSCHMYKSGDEYDGKRERE